MFYLFVYYFIIRKSHWILVYDTSHIQTQSYWLSFSLPPSHWCRKEQMQSGRKMPGSLGCHQCWWLHISMQEIVSGWWKFIPDFGHSKYDNKTQDEKKKKKIKVHLSPFSTKVQRISTDPFPWQPRKLQLRLNSGETSFGGLHFKTKCITASQEGRATSRFTSNAAPALRAVKVRN